MIYFYTPPPIIEPISINLEEKQEIDYIVTSRTSGASKTATASNATGTLARLNQLRQQNGLSALSVSSKLNNSATAKCQDMLTHGYWSHNNPNGTTWHSFVRQQGIYTEAGEILARRWKTEDAMINAWVNSPTHYAQILGNYRYFGIGKCGDITVVHFSQ